MLIDNITVGTAPKAICAVTALRLISLETTAYCQIPLFKSSATF